MANNKANDEFTRSWIIQNSVDIISEYSHGELTIRALHYRLVGLGMYNTLQHYKRVVAAMEVARWDGTIDFETFSDLDREMISTTKYEVTELGDKISEAKEQIRLWANSYRKNRWENQPIYAEVFIEKKALQGVFQSVCRDYDIALGACKGYPSLTFLHEAKERFEAAEWEGKKLVILYFGDYDPSGEDIPRSIGENLSRMGVEVEVKRCALFDWQVKQWNLPPAPAKVGDSRTANWDGFGQVELDAVPLDELKALIRQSIKSVFDESRYNRLLTDQAREADIFRYLLKRHFRNL